MITLLKAGQAQEARGDRPRAGECGDQLPHVLGVSLGVGEGSGDVANFQHFGNF